MSLRGEKPQSGNPHQLTYYQHVFPARSIKRFTGTTKTVELFDKMRMKKRRAVSNDTIFCANRSWDERSEKGYMKDIEDNFQSLVEGLKDERTKFTESEVSIINEYFCLWSLRAERRMLPEQEIQLNAVSAEIEYSQDDEERMEKAGIMFLRTGPKMLARHINGPQIHMEIRRRSLSCPTKWVTVDASEGEFVVPDRPLTYVVQLTPYRCLVHGSAGGRIGKIEVGKLNGLMFKNSENYVFARRLASCPVFVNDFTLPPTNL